MLNKRSNYWHDDVLHYDSKAPGSGQGAISRYVSVNRLGIAVGDPGGNVHEANDAYLDIHGYARAELSDINWIALTPDDWKPKTAASMSAFSLDKGSMTFETEHFHKDGHRVPLSITVMRIQSSGLLLWNIAETVMPASPSTIDPRFAYFQAKRRFGLTDREHEVLALLLEGQSNAEISATLIISVTTASDHVQNVMRKVQVQNRARIFKQVILQ